MNEQEKSVKLAELMGWDEFKHTGAYVVFSEYELSELKPYCTDVQGLAQFAAILLKFPEVIFRQADITSIDTGKDIGFDSRWHYYDFNQTEILDEILRMNGVEL